MRTSYRGSTNEDTTHAAGVREQFRGLDEQEQTDLLEEIVGGPNKGFHLMRVWGNAMMHARDTPGGVTKTAAARARFWRDATQERYTPTQIVAYLTYIGH